MQSTIATYPVRNKLLAKLLLFVKVRPLARPRLNIHSSGIYSPKENQKELFAELDLWGETMFSCPMIIDTYIHFSPNKIDHIDVKHVTDPRYGDDDNLRKALVDGLQHRKIIKDDRLVVGGENFKAIGEEDFAIVNIYNTLPKFETRHV